MFPRIHVEVAAQAQRELCPANPFSQLRQPLLVHRGLVRIALAGMGSADNVGHALADRRADHFDRSLKIRRTVVDAM